VVYLGVEVGNRRFSEPIKRNNCGKTNAKEVRMADIKKDKKLKRLLKKYYVGVGSLPANQCDSRELVAHMETILQVFELDYPLLYSVAGEVGPAYLGVTEPIDPLKVTSVIIGKGVVFDTGGHNIKSSHMEGMHLDKLGAGLTIALGKYLEGNPSIASIIGSVGNEIAPTCTKPGDLIHVDDKIVRITNTDAEGRLVLADAVRLAQKIYPNLKTIYTIATLTGLAAATFGDLEVPVFYTGSKPDTGSDLLPVLKVQSQDFDSLVENKKIIQNAPGKGRGAHTATAFIASFLKEGVELRHFDIAGQIPSGSWSVTKIQDCIYDIAQFIASDSRNK